MSTTTDCCNPACLGDTTHDLKTRDHGAVYQCPQCRHFQWWDAEHESWRPLGYAAPGRVGGRRDVTVRRLVEASVGADRWEKESTNLQSSRPAPMTVCNEYTLPSPRLPAPVPRTHRTRRRASVGTGTRPFGGSLRNNDERPTRTRRVVPLIGTLVGRLPSASPGTGCSPVGGGDPGPVDSCRHSASL
jgi:hypothetical protein